MSISTSLKRLAGSCAISIVLAAPANAAGGNAIGKVADDLTGLFNKLAKPELPPKTPDLDYKFDPPEYVPGGSTTFSPNRVDGVSPPVEGPPSIFNRHGAGSLTDKFNWGAKGN